jgi:hypothetical protein
MGNTSAAWAAQLTLRALDCPRARRRAESWEVVGESADQTSHVTSLGTDGRQTCIAMVEGRFGAPASDRGIERSSAHVADSAGAAEAPSAPTGVVTCSGALGPALGRRCLAVTALVLGAHRLPIEFRFYPGGRPFRRCRSVRSRDAALVHRRRRTGPPVWVVRPDRRSALLAAGPRAGGGRIPAPPGSGWPRARAVSIGERRPCPASMVVNRQV